MKQLNYVTSFVFLRFVSAVLCFEECFAPWLAIRKICESLKSFSGIGKDHALQDQIQSTSLCQCSCCRHGQAQTINQGQWPYWKKKLPPPKANDSIAWQVETFYFIKCFSCNDCYFIAMFLASRPKNLQKAGRSSLLRRKAEAPACNRGTAKKRICICHKVTVTHK